MDLGLVISWVLVVSCVLVRYRFIVCAIWVCGYFGLVALLVC